MYTFSVQPIPGATVYVPLNHKAHLSPAVADPTNQANNLIGMATIYSDHSGGNSQVSRVTIESTDAPGTDQNVTITLVKNTSDTALVAAIAGANTTNSDGLGGPQPADGDRLCLKVSATAGYAGGIVSGGISWYDGN